MYKFIFKIKNLFKYLKYIKYLFSPPFCFYCRININDYDGLCHNCIKLIEKIMPLNLKLNEKKNIFVYALSDYKEPLRSLILAKSYSNKSASIILAKIIWNNSILKNIDFDYLVPVPLHWTRKASRGYNQAEVIAKELSNLSKKPLLDCLIRIKRTRFQSSLSVDLRYANVIDAFDIKKDINVNLENKNIVLVDDLVTTGSTIKSCAKVLIKFNPKNLYAIAACRVCS